MVKWNIRQQFILLTSRRERDMAEVTTIGAGLSQQRCKKTSDSLYESE